MTDLTAPINIELPTPYGKPLKDSKAVLDAIKDGRITRAQGDLLLEGWNQIDHEAAALDAKTKARVKAFDDDQELCTAIIEAARGIVAKVMQGNADKINKTIEANMRELIAERFGNLESRMKEFFDRETGELIKKFKEYDASQRPSFIAAMEEMQDGKS